MGKFLVCVRRKKEFRVLIYKLIIYVSLSCSSFERIFDPERKRDEYITKGFFQLLNFLFTFRDLITCHIKSFVSIICLKLLPAVSRKKLASILHIEGLTDLVLA